MNKLKIKHGRLKKQKMIPYEDIEKYDVLIHECGNTFLVLEIGKRITYSFRTIFVCSHAYPTSFITNNPSYKMSIRYNELCRINPETEKPIYKIIKCQKI